MLRYKQNHVQERNPQGPGGVRDRDEARDEYPNQFLWRGTKAIRYAGPLPSLRPHLVYTCANKDWSLQPKERDDHLRWLLAEPESVCLHQGCAGARLRETPEDRKFRLARRALSKEAAKAKEVKI